MIMKPYGLNELREMFLRFFETKGHLRLPSFSLIPQDDASLLLINSGMAPMKKFFTGEVTPPRRRVTTCQKCIRTGDIENMNFFLNQLTCSVFSFFDASGSEPERFYHGFVLGLLVSLRRRYVVTSNRESGLGRCDVMLEPLDKSKDLAFILEFKAKRPGTSGTLEDAVKEAHEQIERKRYREELIGRGIEASRIRVFGFAFEGKRVLVG